MIPGLAFAVAGVVLAALSFVFTGVVARPLLVAAVALFVRAGLGASRDARRTLRVQVQARAAIAALLGLVVIAGVAFWASHPFFQRRAQLNQLTLFAEEGHRLEADLAARTRASSQPLNDLTSRVQDWHQRLAAWVERDLGTFYRARLGTPQSAASYPPQMHPNLHVFWDVVETDLGTVTQFEAELSRWLF